MDISSNVPRRRIHKYLAYPTSTQDPDESSNSQIVLYDSLDIKISKDNSLDIKLSLSDFDGNDGKCEIDKKKHERDYFKSGTKMQVIYHRIQFAGLFRGIYGGI